MFLTCTCVPPSRSGSWRGASGSKTWPWLRWRRRSATWRPPPTTGFSSGRSRSLPGSVRRQSRAALLPSSLQVGKIPIIVRTEWLPQSLAKGKTLSSKQQIVQGRFIQGLTWDKPGCSPSVSGGKGDGLAGFLLCSFPGPGRAGCPVVWSVSLATPTILELSFLLFLYGFYIHKVRGVLRRPREAVGMFSLD